MNPRHNLLGVFGCESIRHGIKPAVIRQQTGHTPERMRTFYSGESPLDQVRVALSSESLEKMENEAAT
jgi:hypothetical protein